jgi:hypothetical protein
MRPFVAILQAFEASSDPSRIPLLPNTFVRPWQWALDASTCFLTNLRHSTIDPSSITFEDATVSWFNNLLLHGRSATDTTGIENKIDKIFQAFDVTSPTHYSTYHLHKV